LTKQFTKLQKCLFLDKGEKMSTFEKSMPEPRMSKAQRALIGAMLTLLSKNSFQKITVNDLCETALVSRSAFYVYFEDKYHLLKFCMEELKRQILERADPTGPMDLIKIIVDYIYENSNIFKNLMLKETNLELTELLRQLMVRDMEKILTKQAAGGNNFTLPISIVAIFSSGGIASLLMWWIGGGFPVSKEEMADYLTKLTVLNNKG